MRRHRGAVVVAALLLGGCTSDDSPADEPPPDGSSSITEQTPVNSAPSTPPPLAGPSEQAVIEALPDGSAEGSIVITYSGLGEVRSPFSGTCTQDGRATRLEGTAGEAGVSVVFGEDGATLAIDDVGLQSTARITAGEFAVDGNRLSMQAQLVAAEQVIGAVDLDVVCS